MCFYWLLEKNEEGGVGGPSAGRAVLHGLVGEENCPGNSQSSQAWGPPG